MTYGPRKVKFGLTQAAYDGGLLAYIPVLNFRQLAIQYVARILKGEKPANLPIRQPSNFRLVINLKTARTLGLVVPRDLLALADRVSNRHDFGVGAPSSVPTHRHRQQVCPRWR